MLPSLPVEKALPELVQALKSGSSALLQAPPGSGKTTLVPLALLDQPWLRGRSILMLEPRRLAARAAAYRMADLLGEEVGSTVGYRTRLDSRVSAATRIEVVTEGILTRRLQNDPELKGTGLVIFDEFHERNLHTDLGLALTLDVMQGLRDDLRLLLMSATLDAPAASALLGDAPVIHAGGRSYPVEVQYLPAMPEGPVGDVVGAAVVRALKERSGDVLAFLPGAGEIRRAGEYLRGRAECRDVEVLPLHGDLGREQQDRVLRFDPHGPRRVVLATPIAETSLTIEGIRVVVDSGLRREPRFDPASGLSRLRTVRISKAAAEQRAGRAGRLAPGSCYRLWTESVQRGLQDHSRAEILGSDLSSLVLELALWGVRSAHELKWLDPPPEGAWQAAVALLRGLGAIDAVGAITAAGREMAAIPAHPRLAHMLREGRRLGLAGLAADLAGLLSERDPLLPPAVGLQRPVDLETRLEALWAFRRGGASAARGLGADAAVCRRIEQTVRRWRRGEEDDADTGDGRLGLLLAFAYPDRVAVAREPGSGRYRLSGGRGAALPAYDALAREPLLVIAHMDAGQGEGRIHLAASVTRDDLRQHLPEHFTEATEVYWDERQQAVSARWRERFGRVVMDERPATDVAPGEVLAAMLQGIRGMGLEVLPWDRELRLWRQRVQAVAHWFSEQDWPDVSDEWLLSNLEEWLGPYLGGVSRRQHLERIDLGAALHGLLDWSRQRQLDELAPTHLTVPSGSRIRLEYAGHGEVVLAVRLQELFGLAETPRVGGGRIPVTLHLLSPARRPVQVTQDLRGFWERTYPEVKKELKGRYPKHHWPDDPWSAQPTARAKPRRRV